MNNIDRLFRIAKKEEIPNIDISDDVFDRIFFEKKIRKAQIRTIRVFTAISGIAASIILFFSLQVYSDMNNPLRAFYQLPEEISVVSMF